MYEVVRFSVLLLNFCFVYAQYSVDGKSKLNVDQSFIDGKWKSCQDHYCTLQYEYEAGFCLIVIESFNKQF